MLGVGVGGEVYVNSFLKMVVLGAVRTPKTVISPFPAFPALLIFSISHLFLLQMISVSVYTTSLQCNIRQHLGVDTLYQRVSVRHDSWQCPERPWVHTEERCSQHTSTKMTSVGERIGQKLYSFVCLFFKPPFVQVVCSKG